MISNERKKLTKMVLEQRAPASGRVEVRDAESPLVFRITSTGARSLCVRTRVAGEQTRLTFPKAAAIENLSEARRWAQETIDDCKRGIDPRTVRETTELATKRKAERAERLKFENALQVYLTRRVRGEKKNRTADEIEATFNRHVLPSWRGRIATDIGRSDVSELLDAIADGKSMGDDGKMRGGPVAADRTLAQIRAFFNWLEARDEKFRSPIVKGMTRTNPTERKRKRILSDDELRVLWGLLPEHGTYGAIVQLLLLTAQRRDEVAEMARSEIGADCVWTIAAARYKNKKANAVPLNARSVEIIDEQARVDDSDYVFTTTGDSHFSGFSKCKRRLDVAMLGALIKLATNRKDEAMLAKYREVVALMEAADKGDEAAKLELRLKWWRLHDLRRSAKTWMARAGVRPDISERVLGHTIAGVEGTYDVHDYLAEKRHALEQLSAMIDRIVQPPADKVVALRQAAE